MRTVFSDTFLSLFFHPVYCHFHMELTAATPTSHIPAYFLSHFLFPPFPFHFSQAFSSSIPSCLRGVLSLPLGASCQNMIDTSSETSSRWQNRTSGKGVHAASPPAFPPSPCHATSTSPPLFLSSVPPPAPPPPTKPFTAGAVEGESCCCCLTLR